MPNTILHILAHPRFEKSTINKALVKKIKNYNYLTFHDLYESYPDFNINIEQEKKILLEHNIIIWQHPFYWYSCPPLLKQWIDMVLEIGWAYGPGGTALEGKKILQAISTGGQKTAYQTNGYNQYSIREFLIPFERTATLCRMQYLPPFVTHGTHRISEEELQHQTQQFEKLITILHNENLTTEQMKQYSSINQFLDERNNE